MCFQVSRISYFVLIKLHKHSRSSTTALIILKTVCIRFKERHALCVCVCLYICCDVFEMFVQHAWLFWSNNSVTFKPILRVALDRTFIEVHVLFLHFDKRTRDYFHTLQLFWNKLRDAEMIIKTIQVDQTFWNDHLRLLSLLTCSKNVAVILDSSSMI